MEWQIRLVENFLYQADFFYLVEVGNRENIEGVEGVEGIEGIGRIA